VRTFPDLHFIGKTATTFAPHKGAGHYRFALRRGFGGFRSFATTSIASNTLATARRMNWARLLGPTRASIRSPVPFGNRTGIAGSNPSGGRPMRTALTDT
jgi:hypothetical protein